MPLAPGPSSIVGTSSDFGTVANNLISFASGNSDLPRPIVPQARSVGGLALNECDCASHQRARERSAGKVQQSTANENFARRKPAQDQEDKRASEQAN